MDSIFQICPRGNCGISVIGYERENDEYLPDDSQVYSKKTYKYEESITLNVLHYVNSDSEYTLMQTELLTHVNTGIDRTDIEFPKDGMYEVTHIILPTQEYIKKWGDTISIRDYANLYYFDEDMNNYKLFDPITKQSKTVTLDDILNANPCYVNEQGGVTSIVKASQNTFCLCYLQECFYKLCKDSLSKYCGKCANKIHKEDNYNRDIVWMAMNVIKYMIEYEQYYEAQRTLESLTQCGNLCSNKETKEGGGCGCS